MSEIEDTTGCTIDVLCTLINLNVIDFDSFINI